MFARCVAFATFASTALAQTFIVDVANGPGASFTDIATAVAAVPDGAVLEVRAGSYAPFTIANKGLSVLCAPGVMVPLATVSGSSAGQAVEVRGLQTRYSLVLTACQGPLLLADCTLVPYPGDGGLQATNCLQLQAERCTVGNAPQSRIAAMLDGSIAVFRSCTVAGLGGMDLRSSSVQLVDCTVAGHGFSIPLPAVSMTNSDVRVVGGSLYAFFSLCIAGTGTARVDPGVTASRFGHFATPVQGSIVEMPAVIATGGNLGTTASVTLRGPRSSAGLLVAGQPGPPVAFPGIADPSWLQPGTEVICLFALPAPGVPIQVQVQRPVPNLPTLRGLRIAWQGFTYGASSGLQASNPASTTIW